MISLAPFLEADNVTDPEREEVRELLRVRGEVDPKVTLSPKGVVGGCQCGLRRYRCGALRLSKVDDDMSIVLSVEWSVTW